MKKFVIVALFAAAGYWVYQHQGSLFSGSGAFDDQGKAAVLLFTADGCGAPCADVSAELRSRSLAFEEINASTAEGRKRFDRFGVARVPLIVIGNRKIIGSDLPAITSALAEEAGLAALTPLEQQAMSSHFDSTGRPLVVMYGTGWCGYCSKLRSYLDGRQVPYQFRDVEGDSSARYFYDALRGRGYPLTFVGYRRIVGYDQKSMDQALKELL